MTSRRKRPGPCTGYGEIREKIRVGIKGILKSRLTAVFQESERRANKWVQIKKTTLRKPSLHIFSSQISLREIESLELSWTSGPSFD
jgi:hypothetical protein